MGGLLQTMRDFVVPSVVRRASSGADGPPRRRIVILGTGWASTSLLKHVDRSRYDVCVISPRPYLTFTPLLPSVCGGTLSAASVMTSVRELTKSRDRPVTFLECAATAIDTEARQVVCAQAPEGDMRVPYDELVLAVGAAVNTFGIPGVSEHACFLKEAEDAVHFRRRFLGALERAGLPGVSAARRRALLQLAVVGGGPTGVEVAAEVADWLRAEARRTYPHLAKDVKITLFEGTQEVLAAYGKPIAEFTLKHLRKSGVDVRLGAFVKEVTQDTVTYEADGKREVLPAATVLWASGVKANSLCEQLGAKGALPVDQWLRVRGGELPGVYAIGDCARVDPAPADASAVRETLGKPYPMPLATLYKNAKKLAKVHPQLARDSLQILFTGKSGRYGINRPPSHQLKTVVNNDSELQAVLDAARKAYMPPAPTAQAANGQGEYLAKLLNEAHRSASRACKPAPEGVTVQAPLERPALAVTQLPAYVEPWRGAMAYVGKKQAVVHTANRDIKGGWFSLPLWKLTYLSLALNGRARYMLLADWFRTKWTGRDSIVIRE